MIRFLSLALCLLTASTALAQEPSEEDVERARHHFNSGVAYFEDGRFDDAAREFAEAHRLTGHQDVLYNLGQAHDRRGAYTDALEAYRGYLESGQDEAGRVQRRVEELEVLMSSGQSPVENPPPSHSTPEQPQGGGLGLGPIPYVVAGVGVAAGITAIATGLAAQSTHDDLSGACMNGVCPLDRQSDIDSGSTLVTVTNVMWVTAGVLVAAGATLWVLDLTSGGSASTAQVGLGPGSVTARVSF